eukprot:IDg14305t1
MELKHIISLSLLIKANLRKEYVTLSFCTDASMRAAGVCYSRSTLGGQAKNMTNQEVLAWIMRQNWITAFSHKWRKQEHINILEGRAIVLALRHFLRNEDHYKKRVIFLTDNQTLLGALRKGRSSSMTSNGVCRQVASLGLIGDLTIEYYYVPSKDNPADVPSRCV